MASTTARGYGYDHQKLRVALLPYAYGKPCPKCGLTMKRGEPLDLGHTDDRRGYTGIEHADCNRIAGSAKAHARHEREPDPEDPCTSRAW